MAGAAAAGVAGYAAGRDRDAPRATDSAAPEAADPAPHGSRSYPFYGDHQAGIVTPAQDRLHFVALDAVTDSRADLVALLRAWTVAAERMVRGAPAGPTGPVEGPPALPPDDTGEAIGLPPAGLTVTIGFGPGLFDGRFGLEHRRPAALRPLPHFPGDVVDPRISGGDLCIQACADDPQVAVHAVRNLVRIGFGVVSVRWSQLGFGRTSSTTIAQDTPRNLFGFKDGTANVRAEEAAELDRHVWVHPGDDRGADWLAGGSYLVARRIAMTIEVWDRQPLVDQELFVGRTKGTGAPLSGGEEFTEPDFRVRGVDGPAIPRDSHLSVIHPTRFDGARMLRRGYNFVDGSTPLGGLDAGLFFLAYVRDPGTHFVPQQLAMAGRDQLMEYLRFTSSSLFAVPPGCAPGEYVGQPLLA